MPDWIAGTPHLRVRRSGRRAVPGRTLERGKGRNRVAASIKELDCDRRINKIYRDKMAPYLSSFRPSLRFETVFSATRLIMVLFKGHDPFLLEAFNPRINKTTSGIRNF